VSDTGTQAVEALIALRGLVAEAHGVARDLRLAIREARELRAALPEAAARRIEESVEQGLGELSTTIDTAIGDATQAVFRRFDTIAAIALGEDPAAVAAGKRTLADMIRDIERRQGLTGGK
jgi:hypothetical protein